MFWCDSRCSDTDVRFLQFAPVVVEDGKESYTDNLRQRRFELKIDGTVRGALEVLAVAGSLEKEGASWQTMEIDGTRPVFHTACGSISLLQERKRRNVLGMLMLRQRSRKRYKANSNKSLLPKNVWNE